MTTSNGPSDSDEPDGASSPETPDGPDGASSPETPDEPDRASSPETPDEPDGASSPEIPVDPPPPLPGSGSVEQDLPGSGTVEQDPPGPAPAADRVGHLPEGSDEAGRTPASSTDEGTSSSARPVPPPPPPGAGPPPGWYRAPEDESAWRWWDGRGWTGYVHRTQRRPRLPAWLSLPVLLTGVLVIPALVFSLVADPVATLAPLPTFVVVLAAFVWFDRLEPEPRQERIHAVLWGATVAITGASIVNTLVALVFGPPVAAVVSAPIVEELLKGLGVLYAVRRGMVDSVTDGVVYAGWIAAGFAAVENVEYFVSAAAEGQLVATVVIRGLLSPFAHPLFTVWVGIFVGRAIVRGRRPAVGAIPGLLIAIVLHAVWNATTFLLEDAFPIALLFALAFVVLFVVTGVVLVAGRLRERHALAGLVPQVADRYGLTREEVDAFSDWRRTLATRRALSSRSERRAFDARHAAISRLVALHRRPEPPDPTVEQQLVASLWEARVEN